MRDGARVVFGRPGDPAAGLADAVAASCAVPGYYRPVAIDGDRYLDGGVHSPTNLDVVAGGGFDLVVVSSPMSVAADRRCSADLPPRLPGPPRWHASAARSSAPAPEWSSSTAAPNLPQALSRKAIYIVVLIVG